MLTKKEIENYAKVMVWAVEKAGAETGKIFKKGDLISLTFPRYAYDLAEKIYEICIKKGYNVQTSVNLSPKMEKDFYLNADDNQLKFLPNWKKEQMQNTAGSIHIISDEDLLNLADVDTKKISSRMKALKSLRDIRNKNEQNGNYSWTLALWPSEDMAKQAGAPLEKLYDQIRKACFLNKENPVQEWENLYQYNKKVCEWLKNLDIEEFHMTSKNVDLKIKVGENRKFISTSGHNIPSFEVYTSPDCRFTEGTFYADQPSFRLGNVVKGVRLEFKNGECIKWSAEQGEKFLESQLKTDKGASFVGEFSLTDKKTSNINMFMADTLYDENFGGDFGNSHIAIGCAFPDTYTGDQKDIATDEQKLEKGFNTSVVHWDLVNSEQKTVVATCKNGEKITIYKDGGFLIK
ncbi:MAG: aminopeptidase [Alphaproteobacteria bacterium]